MQLPPFEGMHPLVVHFPIAFLMTVWIPALIAVVNRKHGYQWMLVTLLWFAIGIVGVFAAVLTGEAAEDIVVATSQTVKDAVHEHEELGEFVRSIMIVGFLVFAALTAWVGIKKPKKAVIAVGAVISLAIYGFGVANLVKASHEGGVLVHKYGVHAPLGGDPQAVERLRDDDDDDDDDD